MKPEHCHVAGSRCSDPAGIRTNNGVFVRPPRTQWRCPACGEPACAACRRAAEYDGDSTVLCNDCADEAEGLL